MDCSVCGSQDTTRKSGISKTGKNVGKPWVAYDCNEPACKQPNGYPSRTFAPTPKAPRNAPNASGRPSGGGSNPISTLEAKVDKILAILKANFPDQGVTTDTTELVNDETPF